MKKYYWSLKDAQTHLSEIIKKAQQEGPQHIFVRNNPAVVILSAEDYQALLTPSNSLAEFFRQSPLVGLKLNLSRKG